MARLSLVEVEKFSGQLGVRYDYMKKALGRINAISRVWAHLPEVTKFLTFLPMVLQREGAGGVLSSRIKEMVILKTSFINSCRH